MKTSTRNISNKRIGKLVSGTGTGSGDVQVMHESKGDPDYPFVVMQFIPNRIKPIWSVYVGAEKAAEVKVMHDRHKVLEYPGGFATDHR